MKKEKKKVETLFDWGCLDKFLPNNFWERKN